jgi:hypothetical protein
MNADSDAIDGAGEARYARELDEELQFHLESLVREYQERGLAPDEARREAEKRFGDPREIRRRCLALARRQGVLLMKTAIIVLAVLLLTFGGFGAIMYRRAAAAQELARAQEAMAREQASRARVHDFLLRMLTSGDANADKTLTVNEVLERASRRIEAEVANDPELVARLRAAILRAKEPEPAAPGDDRR